jgi:hypothetical protein
MKRMAARRPETVGESLDARLAGDRRRGIGAAAKRPGRVDASFAVHVIEALGLGIIRLHLLIADRPRGRDAVVMTRRSFL